MGIALALRIGGVIVFLVGTVFLLLGLPIEASGRFTPGLVFIIAGSAMFVLGLILRRIMPNSDY